MARAQLVVHLQDLVKCMYVIIGVIVHIASIKKITLYYILNNLARTTHPASKPRYYRHP